MQSEAINELAAALSKAQGQMENATMNRVNPHFKSKYADLASVLDAVRKPLSANGLAITQSMEIREGGMILRTMLMHTSGQWLASEYPLPATATPQQMGSAQTYARRYSIAALVCNSADEDDDAEGAEGGKQKIESKGRAPAKPAENVMHDADTGEIMENNIPHALPTTSLLEFGRQYIAAIRGCSNLDEADKWSAANDDTLRAMSHELPKAYTNLVTAESQARRGMLAVEAAE